MIVTNGISKYNLGISIVVRVHSAITSETVREDKERLGNLPIKNLKAWRDKKLAHIDKGHVLTDTDVMQESPVTIQEIDKIINTIHGILNRYLIAYDGTEWAIGLPPVRPQIEHIINAIRFFRES